MAIIGPEYTEKNLPERKKYFDPNLLLNQPERSKREDSVKLEYKKPNGPEGKYPVAEKLLRCGALNIVETQ